MQWMIYMTQPCGTTVAEVHKMTTEAIESSNNVGIGAVKVEAVESVSTAHIVGEYVLQYFKNDVMNIIQMVAAS